MSERLTVAETTDYDAARNSTLQVRWIRHWATVLGLALADVAAFAVSAELFRVGHVVPRLLFYRPFPGIRHADRRFLHPGRSIYRGTLCLRAIIAAASFSGMARDVDDRPAVASMPCLLLLLFVDGHYSAWAEIFSWTFVIIGIPISVRACAIS